MTITQLQPDGLLERYGGGAWDSAPSWLDSLRAAAAQRFHTLGLPTQAQEDWRFTNLTPLTQTPFTPALPDSTRHAAALLARFTFAAESAAELVFVNGHFAPELSTLHRLPRGLHLSNLRSALHADGSLLQHHLGRCALLDHSTNPFLALNTSAFHDGAFIHLAPGTILERPLHVLFLSTSSPTPAAAHPRVLLVADDHAQATLVETYAGDSDPVGGVYLTNAVTEIIAADHARLDHYKLQQESLAAFHLATTQVHLARDAAFISHSASLGSRLTRNDLTVTLAGEHAEATLNGLVLLAGTQHVDNHTLLDHAAPNCSSHELYKHVLGGHSSGVFKGKILVRPGAQKTDSKQTSKSLLLTDDAVMNSQPALQIYADDVKCTHGCTTGPLDEEMVFYFRSRGISVEAARHLLTYAFAADITRRIRVPSVRQRLEETMAAQHGLPRDLRITELGSHNEASR